MTYWNLTWLHLIYLLSIPKWAKAVLRISQVFLMLDLGVWWVVMSPSAPSIYLTFLCFNSASNASRLLLTILALVSPCDIMDCFRSCWIFYLFRSWSMASPSMIVCSLSSVATDNIMVIYKSKNVMFTIVEQKLDTCRQRMWDIK